MATINRTALTLWHTVLSDSIQSNGPDLSMRQLTILLTIYLEPGPHQVSTLCARFNLPKASVSRALTSLSTQELIKRERDPKDRRIAYIKRTLKGSVLVSELSERITHTMQTLSRNTDANS